MRGRTTKQATGTLSLTWTTVAVLILVTSCGLPTTAVADAPKQPKDKDIALAVKTELLNDEAVPSHLIDVAVNKGIVTLSGSVDNMLAKDRAARRAEMIKGVRAVVNNLEVKPVSRSDTEIQEDVKEALLEDPTADAYDVTVTVTNGKVLLSGKVESWTESQLVERIAKGVRGVRSVTNAITVEVVTGRSDAEIAEDVRARLANDALVDDALIKVRVDNGKVDLDGTVGSASERTRAQTLAWVAGVKAVNVGGLAIEWWARDKMRRKHAFQARPDRDIVKAVEDALLFDARVSSFNPDVSCSEGVVTLTGEVNSLSAKRAAEQDAKNTTGVVRVRNMLDVRPKPGLTDEEIEAKVDKAIKRDPYLMRKGITTTVANGKVHLYGEVDSYFQKYHAEPVVAKINGVVDVGNHLKVDRQWAHKNDWEIRVDIKDQLWWSPFVDQNQVTVSVEDGVATLSGTVDSDLEKGAAVDNAFDGGAHSVRDELKVDRTDDRDDQYGTYPHAYPYPYTPYY